MKFVNVLRSLELGLLFPVSGGSYIYIGLGLGDGLAFLYAWTCILITRPASGKSSMNGKSYSDFFEAKIL